MAKQAIPRERFEEKAREDPYAHMDSNDMEFVAHMDITPIDATKHDDISDGMTWGQRHLGASGIKNVTDYGRHRDECDTLGEFAEMVREEIRDGLPSQYLKVMDEDNERVAEGLVAISKKNGWTVQPHFNSDD